MQTERFLDHFDNSVLFNAVYFIEEETPHTRQSTAVLAIRPRIDGKRHMVIWNTNSSRGEYIPWDHIGANVETYGRAQENITVVDDCPAEITISQRDHIIRLRKLTKELFDQKVRAQVTAGKTLEFLDTESLQNYFLTASFER